MKYCYDWYISYFIYVLTAYIYQLIFNENKQKCFNKFLALDRSKNSIKFNFKESPRKIPKGQFYFQKSRYMLLTIDLVNKMRLTLDLFK